MARRTETILNHIAALRERRDRLTADLRAVNDLLMKIRNITEGKPTIRPVKAKENDTK